MWLVGSVFAQSHLYTEDFTSLQYCDQLNTTAHWDTTAGQIGLGRYPVELVVVDPGIGWIVAVEAVGDLLYAGGENSLTLLDISDPLNPVSLGSVATTDFEWEIESAGDLIYTAYFDGLRVIDVSDPTNPIVAGYLDLPGYNQNLDVAGDHAYVASSDSGMIVVDISDPANPARVGQYMGTQETTMVGVAGDRAYLGGAGLLSVVDITDPRNPSLIGSLVQGSPGTWWWLATLCSCPVRVY